MDRTGLHHGRGDQRHAARRSTLSLSHSRRISTVTKARTQQPQRVLVVEDECMIAMLIEDMLEDLGFDVVYTASTVAQGLIFAHEYEIDLAILDLQIKGERVDPVAAALTARQIPLIYATGVTPPDVPGAFDAAPILSKPFQAHELRDAIDVVQSRKCSVQGLHPLTLGARSHARSAPTPIRVAT